MHPTIEGDGVLLRPTTRDDLPFLLRFFADPAVADVWGAVEPVEIEEKYIGRRSPQVECFIVEHDGRDVGLVQYHRVDERDDGGGVDLSLLPGERGKGLGAAAVAALADFAQVELGWQRFTVDPDSSNVRGVNFWKRVGFVPVRVVDHEPKREPYLLLEWPFRAPTAERR